MFLRSPIRSLIAFAVALAVVGTGCSQLQDLPALTKQDLKFKPPQSSKVYDRYGNLIRTFHGVQNRTVVPLRRIPKHVRRAVVAIEDERFYEHDGVDVRAIFRAMVANIRSGEIREGGSTITQQYVKNVIISPGETAEKTFERKIDEAALARQLEKQLSKREILFRYLNTVYFGEGAYGIQAAAKTFFNRAARDLTLGQAATLAATIRSPETYNPFKKRKRALARRDLILRKMEELGWAEPERVAKALNKGLNLEPGQDATRYPAAYFVDYVQRLIKFDPRFEVVGKSPSQREKRLFTGGLKIYTTIDLNMQAAGEDAVNSILPYPNDPHGALVALETHTGYIRAMVGGRDYFATRKENQFAKLNLATLAEPNLGPRTRDPVTGEKTPRAPGTGRQAGSAFKPFALAAALQQGISLSDTYKASGFMDFPGEDNGATWRVQNYEGSEFGTVTLLEATISSINVVYAQVILEVGPDVVTELARDMGIRTSLLPVPSAVLGSNPVNPLGMASAYSTFATYGTYHPPVAITKIVDSRTGEVIYEDKEKSEEVLEPGVAYQATTALQKVITSGTGTAAASYLAGRPAAGKTGTAQEYRDAWFAGFTPDLATAVWVGYPEGSIEMKTSCISAGCKPTRIQVSGGTWPTQIWGAFMSRALAGSPISAFTIPPDAGLIAVTVDSRTGCLASDSTPDAYRQTTYVTAGTEPTTCAVPTTTIPSVIGMGGSEGRSQLQSSGFYVTWITESQPSAKKAAQNPGLIWKQDPAPGTVVEEGTTITIYVNPF
jgi:penicillin-binding protein 1A